MCKMSEKKAVKKRMLGYNNNNTKKSSKKKLIYVIYFTWNGIHLLFHYLFWFLCCFFQIREKSVSQLQPIQRNCLNNH